MSGLARALLCVAAGLAMTACGYRFINANEIKKDESAFVGALSRRSLGYAGGYVLLFTGLFIAAIVAPLVYLSR